MSTSCVPVSPFHAVTHSLSDLTWRGQAFFPPPPESTGCSGPLTRYHPEPEISASLSPPASPPRPSPITPPSRLQSSILPPMAQSATALSKTSSDPGPPLLPWLPTAPALDLHAPAPAAFRSCFLYCTRLPQAPSSFQTYHEPVLPPSLRICCLLFQEVCSLSQSLCSFHLPPLPLEASLSGPC